MKKFSLRFYVAIITFIVGVFGASIWFFNDYSKVQESDVPPVNISINENKRILDELNRVLEEKEIYEIYSIVLSDKNYDSDLIVVVDYTSHGPIVSATNLDKQISSLTKDTIKDYQEKNIGNLKIVNNFAIKGKAVLISEIEIEELFAKQINGWKNFHEKYPKARGMIRFSQVGFNQEYTQALLNISFGCGVLCGDGSFIILEKEIGKWIIKRRIELWVS